jgi:hypothetical protein
MTNPRMAGGDRLDEDKEFTEFEALREQFGENAIVQLTRQDPKRPTDWPYVGEVPLSDFSLESVKQEYRQGRYRAKVMQNRRYVKGGSFTFSIDGGADRGPVAGSIAGPSADVVELRSAVEKLVQTVTALTTVVATGAAAPRGLPDPLDLMDKMAGIMGKLAPAQGGAGIGQLLDVFKEGVKIASSVQGEVMSDGDSMTPMLRTLQPLIGVIAKNAELEIEAKRNARTLPSPSPAPASPAPAPVSPIITTGPLWAREVRPHVPQLLLLASAGADPVNWAPAVLDMIPESVYPDVVALSTASDFADQVLTALPELRVQEAWTRRLCEELALTLREDETDDVPGSSGTE